jgi:hypothetical protein
MLLALARVVFLGSESFGTRDHILLSDLRLPFSSLPTTRRFTVEVYDRASARVLYCSIWVSCYIRSRRTYRENTFQSRIHGNVCLSPRDGLFPRIYLHENLLTEPLLNNGHMRHNVILHYHCCENIISSICLYDSLSKVLIAVLKYSVLFTCT